MLEHTRPKEQRDRFRSRGGFILACIGSAVGMGNIWLFPGRVSSYGGAAFLIPYFIFVLFIGSTGVIGEMSFGRATKSGPIGAFGSAAQVWSGKRKWGEGLGLIPVFGSLALAIGYSVVVGWIFKYAFGSLTGSILGQHTTVEEFARFFSGTASAWGNSVWQLIGLLVALGIMVFGIGAGIEKANRVMMPLFFLLFIGLCAYIVTLPGALEGYRYIFVLDPRGLSDPMVWVFALGQAFFSLSIAGSGTVVYGSYLDDGEDVPYSAKIVAFFDTIAAMLAAMVIIPAMASAGEHLSSGGPGLMFIFLPNLFKTMPAGSLIMIVFFMAVLFAGVTSLINLLEAPIEAVQRFFRLNRRVSVGIVGLFAIIVGLSIQGIVEQWMNVCSIYLCPIGALLAAVMFFWGFDRKTVLHEVNKGRTKGMSTWFYPVAKYVFCGVTLAVLILGALFGGIG